jgi:hypothetical protein
MYVPHKQSQVLDLASLYLSRNLARPALPNVRPHAARSYGIKYWHQRFPHWPIKIRKCECQASGLNG